MNSLQPQPDGQLANGSIDLKLGNKPDNGTLNETLGTKIAIEFDKVNFSYAKNAKPSQDPDTSRSKHQVLALNDVSLKVTKGEYLAVVGGNGSGKSTLSKLVNALLVPDSGSVLTLGIDTSSTDQETIFKIRSQAGLVLQNPDSQMVASMVADDVAFGPENLCVPYDDMVARVYQALEAVKMGEHCDANPARLSGGQKQRVCIAGLLAMRPQVLVLDEPAAMLDVRGRRGVRRVLRELHGAGLTLILVTHSMEEAAQADKIVILEKGKVVFQGSPREAFGQKALLRNAGLDVPFSVQLAEELDQLGMQISTVVSPEQLQDEILEMSRLEQTEAEAETEPKTVRNKGSVPALLVPALLGSKSNDPLRVQPASAIDSAASIQINNISFSYFSNGKETKALDSLQLNVEQGQFLGIVGHTGSGKSTLLQLMAGLLKASSGSISIFGLDPNDKSQRRKLRSKLGMVFQYPERQLFAATVAADIAFGPQNLGIKPEECDTLVRKTMQMLGLDYDLYAERSPFELSGGEKRRVAVAGVLAMNPDIMIFDEPTAGLDPYNRQAVLKFIKEQHLAGKTMILASHSMDAIASLCTKVIVLDHGKVAMLGTPEQVFDSASAAELRRLNLGLPQTTQFALDLAQKGLVLPKALFNTKDLAAAIANALSRSGLGGENNGN